MNFVKKWLLSKYIQLFLFALAFVFLYTASGSENITLGYMGISIIVINAVLILIAR